MGKRRKTPPPAHTVTIRPASPTRASAAKRSTLRITKPCLASFFCENVCREVDLAVLQLLRRALGNFPVHPKGQSLYLTPAQRELAESLDPSGGVFAPN